MKVVRTQIASKQNDVSDAKSLTRWNGYNTVSCLRLFDFTVRELALHNSRPMRKILLHFQRRHDCLWEDPLQKLPGAMPQRLPIRIQTQKGKDRRWQYRRGRMPWRWQWRLLPHMRGNQETTVDTLSTIAGLQLLITSRYESVDQMMSITYQSTKFTTT